MHLRIFLLLTLVLIILMLSPTPGPSSSPLPRRHKPNVREARHEAMQESGAPGPFQDLSNLLPGTQGQGSVPCTSSLERERSELRDAERERQILLLETPSRRHCRVPGQHEEGENRAPSPTPHSQRAIRQLATLPDTQAPGPPPQINNHALGQRRRRER
ncbi:hypothetical protein B0H17DRAFT_1049146 [Mycena rosella]|uniref:Uncharacterized protein n=1 Tax=Mycena rosella TaxID=1033263 RepID=A0AAD7GKR8_MYCRO|nr:hypothetical protein B0H17DRAFT_1062765 [Mycena rosella]KAJ7699657.1 hypothetical protein B0H17DRAFT_1049146 [Mycena rosella]